jgi:hypothetical protein
MPEFTSEVHMQRISLIAIQSLGGQIQRNINCSENYVR